MNIGFEEDELKPYTEPMPDLNDQMRIGKINYLIIIKKKTGRRAIHNN